MKLLLKIFIECLTGIQEYREGLSPELILN